MGTQTCTREGLRRQTMHQFATPPRDSLSPQEKGGGRPKMSPKAPSSPGVSRKPKDGSSTAGLPPDTSLRGAPRLWTRPRRRHCGRISGEAARGLPESRAAVGSWRRGAVGTPDAATPLRWKEARAGRGEQNPEPWVCSHLRGNHPNYGGDTAHAARSHFLCHPEGRGRRKRLLLPRGDRTCAEVVLTPRGSPCTSSLPIGQTFV